MLGAWGGIGGLGAAAGPLLGGGVTVWAGWPWIFWLNVPLGVGLVVLAPRYLVESRGPHRRIDLLGVVLGSAGLLGLVWGLVEAGAEGWSAPDVLAAMALGALASGGVRGVGAARARPDAADAVLPPPGLRRGERDGAADVRRAVRLAVPAHPAAADGARRDAVGGRAADAAHGGDADAARTGRRRPGRPLGHPAADDRRRRTGRGWARRARVGRRAGGCLRRAGPGDGGDGRGLGVVLRPRGRHRAGRGGADRAGTGLRRRDRGARAGGRRRDRRAGLGLRPVRRPDVLRRVPRRYRARPVVGCRARCRCRAGGVGAAGKGAGRWRTTGVPR